MARALDAETLHKLLSAEHTEIRKQLDDFLQAVHSNNWDSADSIFTRIEQLVDDHLVLEEEKVFPVFEEHLKLSPGASLSHLRQQHQDIRRVLRETGIGLQLHQVREAAMQTLAEVIDRHAADEDAWAEAVLEEFNRSGPSSTILGRLRALIRESSRG